VNAAAVVLRHDGVGVDADHALPRGLLHRVPRLLGAVRRVVGGEHQGLRRRRLSARAADPAGGDDGDGRGHPFATIAHVLSLHGVARRLPAPRSRMASPTRSTPKMIAYEPMTHRRLSSPTSGRAPIISPNAIDKRPATASIHSPSTTLR